MYSSSEPTRRSIGNDLIEEIISRRSTTSANGAPKITNLSDSIRQSRHSVPSSRSSAGQKRRKTASELR